MAAKSQPNVLLLLSDQQTRSALACAGNPRVQTPNLDRLAAGGVRFDLAYCAAPVCGPARASLFTGRMPHEHGVTLNSGPLPAGMPTLGTCFAEAGYDTHYIGKWHVPSCFPQEPDAIPGFVNHPIPAHPLGTVTDPRIADRAVEFLSTPRDRPFLLVVSLQNPHDICHWIMKDRMEHLDTVSPGPDDPLPPLPDNFEISNDEPKFIALTRRPKSYGQETQYAFEWTDTDWRRYLFAYNRLTESLDRQAGRVLDALRRNGLEDNTVTLFTSDHGEGVAEHRLLVKLQLYEGAASVPFLLRGPGISAGATAPDHPVSGIDVVPTLCDCAGIRPPKGLPGVSVKPLADGTVSPETRFREFVVAELKPFRNGPPDREARMVRSRDWKYIRFSGREGEQLFDLRNDPGETRTRHRDPRCADVLLRHRRELKAWAQRTGDSAVWRDF